MSRAKRWRSSLDDYEELCALTFETDEAIDAAIDFLWTSAMQGMPHDFADGLTLIIPADALPYFREAGLCFTDSKVLSVSELTPDEIHQLRRKQGPLDRQNF